MRAVIVAPTGTELSDDERRLFSIHPPVGFILFARNLDSPEQVRKLIQDLRAVVGRGDAPVLIDQEGGRVARLKPPHWPEFPAAAMFGAMAGKDPESAFRAAFINARLIAHELIDLGINVDCAPVLDVPQPGADPVIGDRALGGDPETVAYLGEAVCEGLLAGGVIPVIKHIPGHGRADQDSHKALPRVAARMGELAAVDFRPFSALCAMPWAMTAHVVYTAIDPENPATTSKIVIDQIIRGELDFDGVLISDDVGMEALSGTFAERGLAALAAGCDLALHCSGNLSEMAELLEAVPEVDDQAARRLARAENRLPPSTDEDMEALRAEIKTLLPGYS